MTDRGDVLLALDARPGGVAVGAFSGSRLVRAWRLALVDGRTPDDWGLLLRALLGDLDGRTTAVDVAEADGPRGERSGAGRPARVAGAAVAAVVPGVAASVRAAVADRFEVDAVVVGPGVRTGLPLRTDDPREVGVDRVCRAVAAVHLVGGPCVVVDLESVTTVDVVSARGEHLGGAIAPGVDLAAEALHRHAPGLRRVEAARPARAVGRTSAEALQAGVVLGAAGAVDALVSAAAVELGADPAVLATGSCAELVAPLARTLDRVEPHLGLHGLRLVHERHHARSR